MPRQTINHVTIPRERREILRKQASLAPGQKAFALTERGAKLQGVVSGFHERHFPGGTCGCAREMAELRDLMEQYSQALRKAMEETKETGDGHGETLRF